MSNQLGEMLGVLSHTFGITNDVGEKTQVTIKFDFTTASDLDIKNWLLSNRSIACQRPMRALSIDEINGMNGSTIVSQFASRKTKSRNERIAELVNVGIPVAMAELAVDNPEAFQNAMKSVDSSNNDDSEE